MIIFSSIIYDNIMFTISTSNKEVTASMWRLPQPFARYQNMLQTFQGFNICNFANNIVCGDVLNLRNWSD